METKEADANEDRERGTASRIQGLEAKKADANEGCQSGMAISVQCLETTDAGKIGDFESAIERFEGGCDAGKGMEKEKEPRLILKRRTFDLVERRVCEMSMRMGIRDALKKRGG